MAEKLEKKRISVTMTSTFLEGLDYLIAEGLYLGRGEIVLEGLRNILRSHGVEPFSARLAEPEEIVLDALRRLLRDYRVEPFSAKLPEPKDSPE